ncbi:hypothetical protein [Nitratireductor pacificus]|uniref:Uncharacterized protein n=1 Tax=Nitratireductor pacificus pht-3B TaxID=391937 RepID=K2MFB4_9HYPH|nr:hypothetical protein [Nitratireductor pacificus]EKF20826.1 hypothetical protein NA2_00570 [Nitratireductor pacificus pht-3B]
MNAEARELSETLARSAEISDYDFWRALKSLDDELYSLERKREPIPIDLIFIRAIVRSARQQRIFSGYDPYPYGAY